MIYDYKLSKDINLLYILYIGYNCFNLTTIDSYEKALFNDCDHSYISLFIIRLDDLSRQSVSLVFCSSEG